MFLIICEQCSVTFSHLSGTLCHLQHCHLNVVVSPERWRRIRKTKKWLASFLLAAHWEVYWKFAVVSLLFWRTCATLPLILCDICVMDRSHRVDYAGRHCRCLVITAGNNWSPPTTSGSYSLGETTKSEEKLAEKYLSKIGTSEQVAKLWKSL